MSLSPNNDVVSLSSVTNSLASDGTIRDTRSIGRTEHLVFKGRTYVKTSHRASWRDAGWARILIRADGDRPVFDGAFSIDGDNHHVQTGHNYQRLRNRDDAEIPKPNEAHMIVWRDSDMAGSQSYNEVKRGQIDGSTCGTDNLQLNNEDIHHVYRDLQARNANLLGRQRGGQIDLLDNIGSTDGCPTASRVALLGIATDCTYRCMSSSFSGGR